MSPTCHSNNTLLICWHEFFLECSQQQVIIFYDFLEMILVQSRQTESDAYEPIVQIAQVG